MFDLEERNYRNDRRVRAQRKWYKSFDERTMTATVDVWNYEDDSEEERTVRCRYTVCDICDGKGSHVNPSIDASGITAEDAYEDPDFFEEYKSGVYNVACYGCGGNRVQPEVDPDSKPDWWDKFWKGFVEDGSSWSEY